MRVNMEIQDDTIKLSMFKSAPVFRVNVTAEFSEEEKVALERSGALDQMFLQYEIHPKDEFSRRVNESSHQSISVKNLVKHSGCRPYYLTQIDAQNALSEIEGQFRALKQNILAVDAPKSKSLEL